MCKTARRCRATQHPAILPWPSFLWVDGTRERHRLSSTVIAVRRNTQAPARLYATAHRCRPCPKCAGTCTHTHGSAGADSSSTADAQPFDQGPVTTFVDSLEVIEQLTT